MALTPRGIRNNNPGNLDRTSPRAGWQGATPDSALTDDRFEQFTSPLWGLRALAMTLRAYQERHGCRTLAAIIGRFAPSSENNTGRYLESVCSVVGVDASSPIVLADDPAMMVRLMRSIVWHENGQQPYSDEILAQAELLARTSSL